MTTGGDRGGRWSEALARRLARPWRSVSDLLDDPDLHEERRAEFPEGADRPPDEVTRRRFLELFGMSVAAGGLAACTRAPRERIVPYVTQPPEVTPGVANHYATAISLEGFATGLIVESHEGRPTKIEGNPKHPASLGASSAIMQASLQQLYDPSRARAIHQRGVQRGWRAFFEAFGGEPLLRAYTGSARGQGLHFMMEPTASPLVAAALDRLRDRYPNAEVHFWAPWQRSNAWQGARAVFGRVVEPQYDFTRADVVVSLDADFLQGGPFWLRWARDLTARRRVRSTHDEMNRLYVVEARTSTTGAFADHRIRTKRSEIVHVAAALLAEVLAGGGAPESAAISSVLDTVRARGPLDATIAAIARDLRAHVRKSIVVAGDEQPAEVHALTYAINAALGNLGETVWLVDSPIIDAGGDSHDVHRLLGALDARSVDTLVVLDGNPAYSMPADFDFAVRMQTARERVFLGLYENETARLSTWFLSAAHYLERWGLARAYDGTLSIVQPLIEPLYEGRTAPEVIAAFAGVLNPDAHAMSRAALSDHRKASDFEVDWERWLQNGLVDGTAARRVDAMVDWASAAKLVAGAKPAAQGMEISFDPDPRVHDGAFTNLPWLLELPDPVTKLTWENAAQISPKTAASLGVDNEEIVELEVRGRRTSAPIVVVPGQADDTVVLTLGWGRTGAELLARGLGVNAYALRDSSAPGADDVKVTKTGLRRRLAMTQEHWSLEGRDHLRHGTMSEYKRDPHRFKTEAETKHLYKLPLVAEQQWAMSIDMNACTGCSACVVACQSENNIPVVGKEGVLLSREMHWLRIDRYFAGPLEDPEVLHQPMMCQHCERAPCEYVCPVNATVHSPDGINEQVYNRCIGTRFCSNNCSWKVRRFNWFNYHEQGVKFSGDGQRDLTAMEMNPDVTVRDRGVMEKCTFCVQRVREAEIQARIRQEPIAEGSFTSACAQACPTQAIVFGSLSWGPKAEVNIRRDNDRAYGALEELGTMPRVRYLAQLRNPNEELQSTKAKGGKEE